jgi:hypothetical protein
LGKNKKNKRKITISDMTGQRTVNKKFQGIFKKFQNFGEAEEWEVQLQIKMSAADRQRIARILRERVYGKKVADIREVHKK